jgi:hypothetical protein
LYEILTKASQGAKTNGPPHPLILAAWWETTEKMKQLRLWEQLEWSDHKGIIETVGRFLRSLGEKDWYHQQG